VQKPYAIAGEKDAPERSERYLRRGVLDRILDRMLVLLVRIGLIRRGFYVLEVRGRKSGGTISLLVRSISRSGAI